MPDPNQNEDQNQTPPLQLTPSDLAELHGIAWQLQSAGDPRAARLWSFIEAQSGGGEADSLPNFTLRQSPPQVTSWREDLENELWGNRAGDDSTTRPDGSGDGSPQPDEAAIQPADHLRPDTAGFLDHLSGIGMHAYVAMRDPDPPQYRDWRKTNFSPDGSGNYVSRQGEAYTNDDLKQIHGVLSRQAGNPIISNRLIGPNFKNADYLVWRNQNFSNDRGAWEDEDGNIYSEPAMQQMFGAKFVTQSNASEQASNVAQATSAATPSSLQPSAMPGVLPGATPLGRIAKLRADDAKPQQLAAVSQEDSAQRASAAQSPSIPAVSAAVDEDPEFSLTIGKSQQLLTDQPAANDWFDQDGRESDLTLTDPVTGAERRRKPSKNYPTENDGVSAEDLANGNYLKSWISPSVARVSGRVGLSHLRRDPFGSKRQSDHHNGWTAI